MTDTNKKWEIVRDWLTDRIDSGDLAMGELIPFEPEISKTLGIGRHSVRKALASLAAEGRISIKQGFGTIVSEPPQVLYTIGKRTRFSDVLRSQGLVSRRETISSEIIPAPEHVARALQIEENMPVTRHIHRGLANDVPISISCGWFCAVRFPAMSARRKNGESTTEIYRSYGIEDYVRRQTILSARKAEQWEARLLHQPTDTPVVEQEKIDITLGGEHIGYGEHIWAAGRVRFQIDTEET